MKPETWVAIYAAVIGTSAFFLNLKMWLESGVKLKLSVMPDGMVIGSGDPDLDEKDLIILSVMNRGDAATNITSMILFEITSWWQLWRIRPAKSYVVTNPQFRGYPPNLPSDLEPGKKWTGAIRQRPDIIADLLTGTYYTGIYTTARDRPYLIRIPKKRKLPEGTRQLP
jgi:hypothetical protein